ncbi:26S proteasome non-ATPase regulatory subunit Nin1/mts3 family protein [Aphelenchoides avenae]|nr:26S proteasome non-ATPase regulatory subunit Nin1/mts3 family protein [Aphelenchus avenae]
MSLESLHKNLLSEWKAKRYDAVVPILAQIKQELTNEEAISRLSPAAAQTIHSEFLPLVLCKKYVLLGDYFELNALSAVVRNDMESFGEAIEDVHSLYECGAPESTQKYLMYGLHLMHLLVKSKLSTFHILLEQIAQKTQQENAFIAYPVKLEQAIMEGAYNKVILDEKSIPSPYYAVFVTTLLDTVRNEIADCMEKSFKRLLLKDAANMLIFAKEKDLAPFADKRGWKIEKDVLRFDLVQQNETTSKPTLDTKRIALQSIFYAKQLEMIV